MPNRSVRAAFTLVEVLVVVAIVVLLMSILLPSLQGARDNGRRAKCLSNLRESARLAQYNAQEDSLGRLHTPHPAIREENRAAGDPPPYWLGRGDHEWGGADGELPEYNLTGAGGNPGKDSARRFLNRFLYGVRGGQTEGIAPEARRNDWQIFQETGEDSLFGRADAANMSMRPRDRLFETSVFRATGNSYSGDPFGLVDPFFNRRQGDQTTPEIRFGSYKRPIEKFADIARNVLFWESRFTQAIANTTEIAAADFDSPNQQPVRFGQIPQTIPGHHRKAGYFNVAFADGHAAFVTCRRSGDLDEPTDFRDGRVGWRVHWRASTWRYDSLPRRGTQSMTESRPFLAIGDAFSPMNDVRVINQPGAMSP